MHDWKRHTTFCVYVGLVGLASLLVWSVLGMGLAPAHAQPPPPPDTPTWTPTTTKAPVITNTFTPTPSSTPSPTNTHTPTPSNTPSPTSTHTPTPKVTFTATATRPASLPTEPPQPQPTDAPPPGSNPECGSRIEGTVVGSGGKGIAGATVVIQGEGWTDRIMTNDMGGYGFASLCAGTVALQAYLPDGQATPVQTITLTGKNVVRVDLYAGTQSTRTPGPTNQPANRATATTAPEMPVTGSSGWLLLGTLAVGMLLFVIARICRTARARL